MGVIVVDKAIEKAKEGVAVAGGVFFEGLLAFRVTVFHRRFIGGIAQVARLSGMIILVRDIDELSWCIVLSTVPAVSSRRYAGRKRVPLHGDKRRAFTSLTRDEGGV
jgi:hypothetical protein